MEKTEKRTSLVPVRMAPGDLARLLEAAKILWPGAVVTQSGVVLGLAKMKADEVVKKKRERER